MAEKKPLCLYGGVPKELAAGDSLPAASSGSLLVGEVIVSGSAVSSVTFSGLDGNAAGGYTLRWSIINPTATGCWYTVSGTNFPSTWDAAAQINFTESIIVNIDAANNRIFYADASSVSGGSSDFSAVVNNTMFLHSSFMRYGGSIATALHVAGTKTGLTTIGDFTITSANVGGFGVGSTFQLYRRK